MTTEPVSVTKAQLVIAFEAWETDVRADRSLYMSPEECAAMGVSELSDRCASHLLALIAATKK